MVFFCTPSSVPGLAYGNTELLLSLLFELQLLLDLLMKENRACPTSAIERIQTKGSLRTCSDVRPDMLRSMLRRALVKPARSANHLQV